VIEITNNTYVTDSKLINFEKMRLVFEQQKVRRHVCVGTCVSQCAGGRTHVYTPKVHTRMRERERESESECECEYEYGDSEGRECLQFLLLTYCSR
jgi:hypothetical protein